ncbi:pilus assembly protein TadG-related protein [Candidatus Leptofilum sp.]|uniref:pilus assembly protein TadG-related protein n=1 Tax=Candidatus Leptofilum sp. TaxID=3241576 RepID=UPI003B5C4A78
MNRIKQFIHQKQAAPPREKGQSIVLIALMMVAIIAFVGIAIDVGFIFARGSQLQAAIDSAALAGVTELSGWTPGNTTLENNARTKSAQFLNANNMPVSVTNSLNITGNLQVSTTPLGATQYAVTATWPVETYFLKVIGFREPIDLTRSATAAIFALADIYVSRRVEDGVLSTSNQGVFGPDSCVHMGDPYSPFSSPFEPGPYTYTYRIYIPPDYSHDIVRVELFDPDSINTDQNTLTILRSNLAITEGQGATDSKSCTGGSADRFQPCLLETDELDLVSADIELDQINPYWFVRIDENRRPPTSPGGNCGAPDSYTPSMNTETLYSLYYFAQNASGTISRVPLVSYIGQTGDGVRDSGDHLTDMRWVSPGATNPFSPVDSPGVAVPAITQTADSFEIDLTADVPGIVTDPSDGTRFIFLDVRTISGSSENGFEIWAGPPTYTDGDSSVPDVPSEVNARNLAALNFPGSHSSEGVTVYGLGNLPMNSNFGCPSGDPNCGASPIDIPLIYVGPDMIGQTIQIRMWDSDSGASPPVVFFFDSIAFTPDDSDPLGYDPDATDWAMAFAVDGQDDPDGVAENARCDPGSCDSQWVDPAYNITVPGDLSNCDYNSPTMEDCTPFTGGRLTVRYRGGFSDTYGWEITLEGLPYLVK